MIPGHALTTRVKWPGNEAALYSSADRILPGACNTTPPPPLPSTPATLCQRVHFCLYLSRSLQSMSRCMQPYNYVWNNGALYERSCPTTGVVFDEKGDIFKECNSCWSSQQQIK